MASRQLVVRHVAHGRLGGVHDVTVNRVAHNDRSVPLAEDSGEVRRMANAPTSVEGDRDFVDSSLRDLFGVHPGLAALRARGADDQNPRLPHPVHGRQLLYSFVGGRMLLFPPDRHVCSVRAHLSGRAQTAPFPPPAHEELYV